MVRFVRLLALTLTLGWASLGAAGQGLFWCLASQSCACQAIDACGDCEIGTPSSDECCTFVQIKSKRDDHDRLSTLAHETFDDLDSLLAVVVFEQVWLQTTEIIDFSGESIPKSWFFDLPPSRAPPTG